MLGELQRSAWPLFSGRAGQLYALLGPNGAGKATTIACLIGFERPDEGRVAIDGIDVAQAPDAARLRVAYILEQVPVAANEPA